LEKSISTVNARKKCILLVKSVKECEQAVEVGRESRADFKLIAKVWEFFFIKHGLSFGRFLNVLLN
jgi:hypothetical protein